MTATSFLSSGTVYFDNGAAPYTGTFQLHPGGWVEVRGVGDDENPDHIYPPRSVNHIEFDRRNHP